MTMIKWNRGRGNGNSSAENSQTGMPLLFNSWLNSRVPSLLDTNSLLQDFFDDDLSMTGRNIGTLLPAVNISETADSLEIEVAAPGMKKKDFKIEMNNNQLCISYNKETTQTEGQPEGQQQPENKNSWRREFNFESFKRTFTLPEIVDGGKISAGYEDGILRLTIPKKEEARKKPARVIEVK